MAQDQWDEFDLDDLAIAGNDPETQAQGHWRTIVDDAGEHRFRCHCFLGHDHSNVASRQVGTAGPWCYTHSRPRAACIELLNNRIMGMNSYRQCRIKPEGQRRRYSPDELITVPIPQPVRWWHRIPGLWPRQVLTQRSAAELGLVKADEQ